MPWAGLRKCLCLLLLVVSTVVKSTNWFTSLRDVVVQFGGAIGHPDGMAGAQLTMLL
jgi:hypothetical protein